MSKRLKMSLLAISIITALSLVGCGNKSKITEEEYKKAEASAIMGESVKARDVENAIRNFVTKVYAPKSDKDITDGIEGLKDIVTPDLLIEFKDIAGKYNKDVKMEVQDLKIHMTKGINTFDGLDKVAVEFKVVKNGDIEDATPFVIDFTFNQENRIMNYNIWMGIVRIIY